jgi:hypothetical protein
MARTTIYPAPGKTVRAKHGGKIPAEGIEVELADPYYRRRLSEGGITTTPPEGDPAPVPTPPETDLQPALKRARKGD